MSDADTTTESDIPAGPQAGRANWAIWIIVVSLVYLLLVGVGVIGEGFKWVSGGSEGAEAIFAFASNPVVGVILGILATALVQSSSTVTSVIVGLVAGGVPVSIAVPMIMGANMGTSITSTLVSIGNIRDDRSFGKSFQAATIHDFFNLYSILIFLPIEMIFHPLERLAGYSAEWFVGSGSGSMSSVNVLGAVTKPVAGFIVDACRIFPGDVGGYVAILIGIGMVFASVVYLGKELRKVMTGRAKKVVESAIGTSPARGIASGTVITVMVQSSSTTTSLIVPLAGSGVLNLKQIFPFTMGANIGTCITALLAATAVAGDYEVFAVQIALVHLFYNVLGVTAFSLTPWLRNTPVNSAVWLGNRAAQNRYWALGYLLIVFFIAPGAVLGGQSLIEGPDAGITEVLQEEGLKDAEDAVADEDVNIE